MELLRTAVIMSMTILIIVSLLRMFWTLPIAEPPWLVGRKCTEMNQCLPRAVDEVEVGLGRLRFHINPHQVRF